MIMLAKGLFRSGFFSDNDHQKLGYEYAIDLHFDGVGTLSPEVSQRKILFDLFEQQLDHPPVFIDNGYLGGGQRKIVGERRYRPSRHRF